MKPLRHLLLTALVVWATPIDATDLIQAMSHALNNDPAYKAAESQWLAGQEDIPIQRAAFLPQLTATANAERVHTDQHQTGALTSQFASGTVYSNNHSFGVSVDQTLFDYRSWSQLASAKASVRRSAAQYAQAAENLLFRTAKAYFDVLKANAVLQADIAEREHLNRQLEQTRHRYEAGVDDVTKLDETRSRYESAVAKEISDRNQLASRVEDLRAITDNQYDYLRGLGDKAPLNRPDPDDINQWVNTALQQNYQIKAKRFAELAAKHDIGATNGQRFPVFKFNSAYNEQKIGKTLSKVPSRSEVASFGVSMEFPAFQGGGVYSQTKKAQYQYQQAGDELQKAYRNTVRQTRQSYLQIISNLGNIKANKQAIKAARSALKSSRAAYKAGTRTFVDVLDRQSEFYQAKRNYAEARYNFLIATLNLKNAAGTLTFDDIRQINSWLHETFNVEAEVLPAHHQNDES